MILFWENGTQIPSDLVVSYCLRSDLAPVPLALELDIRVFSEIESLTRQGRAITLMSGEEMQIVKREKISLGTVRNDRMEQGVRLTALLKACLPIAFTRRQAIIKEDATLAGIYRAAGASVRAVAADFPVPRFTCLAGETPSYQIRQVLQEEAGVVRWKNGKLEFFRYRDLFRQTPKSFISLTGSFDTQSGLLERHTIPAHFSIRDDGLVVFGNRDKDRSVAFSPVKTIQTLNNMGESLINRAPVTVGFDIRLAAGDLFSTSMGEPMVAITVVHTYNATEGQQSETSRLFLGTLA